MGVQENPAFFSQVVKAPADPWITEEQDQLLLLVGRGTLDCLSAHSLFLWAAAVLPAVPRASFKREEATPPTYTF